MSAFTYLALQTGKVAEQALKTSPYNAAAYGVLVLVLMSAIVFLWREYRKSIERERSRIEKTIGVIQIVESKLDAVDEMQDSMDDLEDQVSDLSRYINELRTNESN